ncbi:MAG TPA: TetR family transcriptional regulator [Microlunatus sp.]
MTDTPDGSRAEQRRRTEARILEAAAELFLDSGYERTTIRAVAAAAAVQPGLVMHYFTSKQQLFQRVIEAAPTPDISGAEQILTSLANRLESEPSASLTILRSMLTNPEAADAVAATGTQYRQQIAEGIPADDAGLRAAIIDALILGLVVSRHLIKSDELAAADTAQIIELLRPCVLSLTADSDTHTAKRRPRRTPKKTSESS